MRSMNISRHHLRHVCMQSSRLRSTST